MNLAVLWLGCVSSFLFSFWVAIGNKIEHPRAGSDVSRPVYFPYVVFGITLVFSGVLYNWPLLEVLVIAAAVTAIVFIIHSKIYSTEKYSVFEKPVFATILYVSLFYILSIVNHIPYINGCCYWSWAWRNESSYIVYLYLIVPFFIFMGGIGLINSSDKKVSDRFVLFLFVIVSLLFQLGGMLARGNVFESISEIIISPVATSYYTDATRIGVLADWLKYFHLVPLNLHSNTHPPGPIIYYYLLIQIFGADTATYIGGLILAVLSSLGVVVIYYFSELWTKIRIKRLTISGFYSLLPGLIVFFPEFDQVYPILSMTMVYFWERSLRSSLQPSVVFGLALFLVTVFAYNLLVIGVFFIFSGAHYILENKSKKQAWKRVLIAGSLVSGTVIICHLSLYLVFQYDAIASFFRAIEWQKQNGSRPHSIALLLNIYDFSLASGMSIPLFFLSYIYFKVREKSFREYPFILTMFSTATILIVNLSGLLDSETARVWLFLQPFILVPAVIEILRFGYQKVFIIAALQYLTISSLIANMIFISP